MLCSAVTINVESKQPKGKGNLFNIVGSQIKFTLL